MVRAVVFKSIALGPRLCRLLTLQSAFVIIKILHIKTSPMKHILDFTEFQRFSAENPQPLLSPGAPAWVDRAQKTEGALNNE